MAKCHRNNVGSLVLEHGPAASTACHFRLWNAFSAAGFRRKIFYAVSCGGGPRYRHELQDEGERDEEEERTDGKATAKTKTIRAALNDSSGEKGKVDKRRGDGNGKKSEKLSDLLSLAEVETEGETRKKEEALEEFKRVVKELQLQDCGEGDNEARRRRRVASATKVRMLAKEDPGTRVTLALLGAIPPLVGMVDESEGVDGQIAALYALLNLGIGNDANRAAIVKAGAIHKMLKVIESPESCSPAVAEAAVANFLGLSALDQNKPIIGSSGVIPFLVKALRNSDGESSSQAKEDALRALYNLSIFQPNIFFILETDLVAYLMDTLGDMQVSERILSILSNVVSTPEGRRAISVVPDGFPILVDVLNWADAPGCQEKASYILMVMAHKAYVDRQAMVEAGVVSSLLELTLLGSNLAQKRASRLLECLRVDKGKQVSSSNLSSCGAAVSAPIYSSSSTSLTTSGVSKDCLTEEEDMMSEERKAVKQLVQQSLQSNMRRIVKRANLPQDFVPSEHFKHLTASSTSKSLPF